jgi:predicted O-methyltransferase YrrM
MRGASLPSQRSPMDVLSVASQLIWKAPGQAFRRVAEDCAVTLAMRRVSSFANRHPSVDEAVSFAYSFRFAGFGIPPVQIRSEILRFLQELVASEAPLRRVLEIGTSMGGTLFLLSTAAADDARLLSIDLPQGPFGGGYSARKDRLYRGFARRNQHIDLLRSDSHERRTLDWVEHWLDGAALDLLFADGDHSYNGLVKDLEFYSPLVRMDGLVVLHDIVPGLSENVGGVPDLWQELRSVNESSEIVENWLQGGYGLGILRKTGPIAEPIRFMRKDVYSDAG